VWRVYGPQKELTVANGAGETLLHTAVIYPKVRNR
jgi:hypothetical protein